MWPRSSLQCPASLLLLESINRRRRDPGRADALEGKSDVQEGREGGPRAISISSLWWWLCCLFPAEIHKRGIHFNSLAPTIYGARSPMCVFLTFLFSFEYGICWGSHSAWDWFLCRLKDERNCLIFSCLCCHIGFHKIFQGPAPQFNKWRKREHIFEILPTLGKARDSCGRRNNPNLKSSWTYA